MIDEQEKSLHWEAGQLLWESSLEEGKGGKKDPKEGRLQLGNLRLDVRAWATTGTGCTACPCVFMRISFKGVHKLHSPGFGVQSRVRWVKWCCLCYMRGQIRWSNDLFWPSKLLLCAIIHFRYGKLTSVTHSSWLWYYLAGEKNVKINKWNLSFMSLYQISLGKFPVVFNF